MEKLKLEISRLTLLKFLLIALFVCTAVTCKKDEEEKQPVAMFTSDKAEYIEGETVHLHSSSQNASSFRWTMPDGQTQTGDHVTYLIPEMGIDREIQVKLEVFSESRNKSDLIVKNLNVKAAEGKLLFYSYYFQSDVPIRVDVIPGGSHNLTLKSTSTVPNCNDASFQPIPLVKGDYYIQVYYGSNPLPQMSKNISIGKDECEAIHFP